MGQSQAKTVLKPRARELRNRPSEPELQLWRRLRNSQLGGFKFRRQAAIPPFVADFLCPLKALIVEVDGWTHDAEQDRRRDQHLKTDGYTTLRFSNTDVIENMDGVLFAILERLRIFPDRWPHPNPSPEGEWL
ncbi:MAG: endonuclease domain-containing protein [Pseudomonadota bacterium]